MRHLFMPACLCLMTLSGAWDKLRGHGYYERFRRLWDFYLSSSEAGFLERRIGDVQVLFAKPSWR